MKVLAGIVYFAATAYWALMMWLVSVLRCDDSCSAVANSRRDDPSSWQYGVVGHPRLRGRARNPRPGLSRRTGMSTYREQHRPGSSRARWLVGGAVLVAIVVAIVLVVVYAGGGSGGGAGY